MATTKPAEAAKTLRANEKKWGGALMQAGWTIIPNQLLERQQALGLDAVDINILLHIIRYWWEAEKLPFPSKATIAKCIGVHPRTVQRRLAKLEHDGLIRRVARHHPVKGRQTNEYDFSGLIKAATPFAHEFLAERKRRQQEDEQRLTRRGRPKLTVVAANEKEKQ